MRVRVPIPLLVLFLPLYCGAAVTPRAGQVVRVAERRIPWPDPPAAVPTPRVDRAYFDAGGRLQWDGTPLPAAGAAGGCETGTPAHPPRARLARPRVDELHCPDPQQPGRLRKLLVGYDERGAPAWRRPLVFRSGPAEIEQWLIGATHGALVLSNLEVWAPATGATVEPARTRAAGPAARPVPEHHFSRCALFVPARREFLVFEADVTLLRRDGGLYRVSADSGARELWLPIAASLLGTFDRVEAMDAARDGRTVVLGLRQETRGPSSVAVALRALDTGELLFEERFCAGRTCADPQAVAGPEGEFAFAYRDDNAREHVLVHYRRRP